MQDFRNKMWSTAKKEEEDMWVPYEWHVGEEVSVVAWCRLSAVDIYCHHS